MIQKKICGVDEFLNVLFLLHVVTNSFTQTLHHEGCFY